MTEDEREAARVERRDVIESNKAWDSATTVRRDWLHNWLTRKTAPKGTASFLAVSTAEDADTLAAIGGNHLAANLLGAPDADQFGRSQAITSMIETAGDARAQVIHLALALAAYEAATSRDDWRHPIPRTSRYLTHLATLGYTLSAVEQRAVAQPA